LTRGGKNDISYYVWDKNPTFGTGLILPDSYWLMTYGKGMFEKIDQNPALWNADCANTKQNGRWDDPPFYVRRLCHDCAESHQDIIYKRLTEVPSDMDLQDLFLANWFDKNNNLGVDFKLYSTFEDAQNDTNEWQFCNYNDPGIGFPRDCGPVSAIGSQWNSLTRGGKNDISYYVWDTEAATKYSRLVTTSAKRIRKECKITKSFECQKVVRKIKAIKDDSNVDDTVMISSTAAKKGESTLKMTVKSLTTTIDDEETCEMLTKDIGRKKSKRLEKCGTIIQE